MDRNQDNYRKEFRDLATGVDGMYFDPNANGNKNYTEEETLRLVALLQAKYIKTIKNCVMFFTILTVLELIAGIIAYMSIFG